MPATEYRIAPAPKFASQMEFDCDVCKHETLTRPVFLTNGGNAFAAGTGCAAKLLFGAATARTRRLVRTEADAIAHREAVAADMRDERMIRFAAARVALAEGRDADPALISARATYWAMVRGAWAGHRHTFPAYLLLVAATGEIDQ